MATSWRSWYVKCPFYHRDEKKDFSIFCEGVTDGNEIVMKFDNPKAFEIQADTFCCDKYEYCEVYNLLMQFYEED